MYKFIGFVKADYRYDYEPLPDNARLMADRSTTITIITGLLGIAVGYVLLLVKQYILNGGEAVLNKPFILFGAVLGALFLLLHEFLHLIPYPKNSTKIISIKGGTPSAFCSAAVSKGAFIVSSLLPVLLGIIPLILFMFLPSTYQVINTILWTMGTIGLASPANDYADVLRCLRSVPYKCKIQSGKGGFYYFGENTKK
ncbi:MAG: DUF3267 domain-containing protein [Ruminococcus sp.]|jgi:hypothetical protein|nr:DUF3267 domain-containing protein [Ruminococcus sp.]